MHSLTWLEQGVDHAGHLLRVEQAICTHGVCNPLLIPVAVEYQTAKFLVVGTRVGHVCDQRILSLQTPPL